MSNESSAHDRGDTLQVTPRARLSQAVTMTSGDQIQHHHLQHVYKLRYGYNKKIQIFLHFI